MIGREARYLADEQAALDHIAGYAVSNDVSEREYQIERGGQWVKGKSCETFNPLGPWLVTPDEIDDVQSLAMTLDVNGERLQDGSTKTMVFSVAHIVWYLSQFMILEPGDLINTGTPPGVGLRSRRASSRTAMSWNSRSRGSGGSASRSARRAGELGRRPRGARRWTETETADVGTPKLQRSRPPGCPSARIADPRTSRR